MKRLLILLFLLPFFLFGQNTGGEPGRNIDSLKLALKNAKHDTVRCNILSALAENADDDEWPAFNEQLKSLTEKNIANNSTPKKFYLKHLANALNNVGFLSDNKGDIPKALENFHKSLTILEELGYKKETANSLNNIAGVYKEQGDFFKALDYYNKSLKICKEISDKKGIAEALGNLGTIYQDENNIPKALDHYNRSLKISEEIGYKEGIANTFNNLGTIYKNQKEDPKALDYFQKSLKIQEEISDKHGVANSLTNIANLLMKENKLNEAIVYANKGMQISQELGYPTAIKRSANSLKAIFILQNKYKEAFEMYDLEVQMKDSIRNEETKKATIKKQMQYDYDVKARELKNEQDKKNIIAQEELKQREKERNYFIIGFGLVIILALFIFRGYRQKQKANILINKQKLEVEESKKQIIDSINYAKRIQGAHLPSEIYIKKSIARLQNKT